MQPLALKVGLTHGILTKECIAGHDGVHTRGHVVWQLPLSYSTFMRCDSGFFNPNVGICLPINGERGEPREYGMQDV